MIPDHIARYSSHIANNRERIEASYLKALDLGAPDLAAFLLDLRDQMAREIGEQTTNSGMIDARIVRAGEIGATPFATWGMPRRLAVEEIADAFPAVAMAVASQVTLEGFWAVVVAEGSASAVVMLPAAETRTQPITPSLDGLGGSLVRVVL